VAEGFREPASLLPLRWGGYRSRYLGALVLLVAGGLLIQATSVYAIYLLVAGAAAHLAGWLILPGRGWRRVAVSLPSMIGTAGPLIGSFGALLLVLCLLGWLWVRQRPGRAYPVLVFPVISAIVLSRLFPQYGDGGIVVLVSLVVLVGSAWLARAVAGGGGRSAAGETGR